MSQTGMRIAFGALIFGGLSAAFGMSSAPPTETVRETAPETAPTPPTLGFTVPRDLPANPDPDLAAAYAWRSFVAVNWPARSGGRGIPDPSKLIGQPGDVVWGTWKMPEEIFLPDGARPVAWDQYGGVLPPQCTGATRGELMLMRVAKAPGAPGDHGDLSDPMEAIGGTLTDQNRNLARFEIRMNRTIFDDIVAKTLYNVQGQDAARSILFPSGVMEIKAAWRQLTASDASVKSRFFRRQAWIYTAAQGRAPARCVRSEVGLVGLHVTQKTPSRPQWTWATFEQIDNVSTTVPPPQGPSQRFSFYNPGCPVAQCPPNTSTERNGVPTGIPTQVTRVVPIGAAAARANPLWQAALRKAVPGSPFQYYQLVDIQWPQNPATKPVGDPTPGLIANTTMETYIGRTSSCIQCHFTAQRTSGTISSDYSFTLSHAFPRK